MSTINLHLGDARTVLQGFAAESVDSIVCDPPYGLSKEPDMVEVMRHWLNGDDYTHTGKGFMGKSWDSFVPGPSVWKECLRVLKPGGHLVAFFGSRTYDMGTLAVRLAGFEIRDQLMWIYGSGFPKSLDVSKAIDKAAGAERNRYERAAFGGTFSDDNGSTYGTAISNIPITQAAQQWQGWGTALKPAHEPIVLARKPLAGTVVQNVLSHGTGAVNIDGCRIEKANDDRSSYGLSGDEGSPTDVYYGDRTRVAYEPHEQGRFPANVLHDGSDEVSQAFDQFGQSSIKRIEIPSSCSTDGVTNYDNMRGNRPARGYTDSGNASRFFYGAKADRSDRNEGLKKSRNPAVATNATMRQVEIADWSVRNGNHHPTVKPTDLMQWLCRLVTPPGGIVLDPFMGSGSTGKGAVKEGFSFIGVELEQEYFDIASARIHHAHRKYGRQLTL